MDYYKVLLVDDEEDVRQAIVRKLDWNSLGFQVVGEAGNGEEALELAERLEPDVVMTDIKMPFMDGLELCRRVKALLPGVRVAILSGFDEFEYAREAITQQVQEYILKPIDADKLRDVFARIRQALDKEITARRDVERLRRHYEESLPLLRQQFLFEVLVGGSDPALLTEKIERYGLEWSRFQCVAVVRGEQAAVGGEPGLVSISLQQLIADVLGQQARYHLLQSPEAILLLFLLERDSPRQVTDLLGPLFPLAKKQLGIHLSIGVGKVYSRPEDAALSYREASGALEYQLLMEPGQCIYIGDIEPGAVGGQEPDSAYAEEVLRQIKVGGEEELRGAVRGLAEHLKTLDITMEQCQIYLLELFTELMRLIRTYRMDPVEAGQQNLLVEGVAMRFVDLEELNRWLFDYCDNLRRIARRERKDSVRLLVDQAKQLIAEHYSDSDLSLEWICGSLNVSPTYFSTVFKKETGQGFVGYLTALRMDKALELIASTDDKTYQIADKIGYADPNYFSYVFKRRFGVSPSKYKAVQSGTG